MNRREFTRSSLVIGAGTLAGFPYRSAAMAQSQSGGYYEEPAKKLPIRKFDVVVVGAGTGGVVAALAAARRWKREGRTVRIARPPTGMDFNDVLLGRAASAQEGAA